MDKIRKNRSQNRVHRIELHIYWIKNRRKAAVMLGREFWGTKEYIFSVKNTYFRVYKWLKTGFELVIVFSEHLQNVNTNNYNTLAELHIPKITVNWAHIISSQFAMSSQWLPGDGSQQCLLTSCSLFYLLRTLSQLTHCSDCPNYNIGTDHTENTALLLFLTAVVRVRCPPAGLHATIFC